MWFLLRDVSWRRARQNPLRTLLVVLGIGLGVSIWSAVLATNDSLVRVFEEMVEQVSGTADLIIAGGSAGIPDTLVEELAESDDIDHVMGTVEVTTHTVDGTDPIVVLGVDFVGDTTLLRGARDGSAKVVDDPMAFVNDASAILLTTTFAKQRGLKVGDHLALATPDSNEDFQVRGLMEPKGLGAIFAGNIAVMFRDTAQMRFGRGPVVDRIDVAVRPGRNVDEVKTKLRKQLLGRAEVDRPSGRAEQLTAAVHTFQNGLNLTAALSILVGMFLIYNAVSISVAQRRRELAIVRALGATKRTIVALICAEAILMSVLGICLGLVMATRVSALAMSGVAKAVSQTTVPIHPGPPVISLWIAASSALLGVLVTLGAAYIPALKASQIEPAEAVRSARAHAALSSPPARNLAGWGLALAAISFVISQVGGGTGGYGGVMILAAGAILVVPIGIVGLRRLLVRPVDAHLGMPGRLGLDNVSRALGRSTVTIAGLMLAVSMSISLAAYAEAFERSLLQWADDAFPADATITKGAPLLGPDSVPFLRSMVEPLRTIPGLAATNFVRLTYHMVRGRRVQLTALDTRVDFEQARIKGHLRQVVAGPQTLEASALVDSPSALVSENLANRLHLAPGDELRLATHNGEKVFKVYAVVVNYSGPQGWMMVDQRWYQSFWSDRTIDSVDLHFAPGVNEYAALAEIRTRLGPSGGLFVTSHRYLREHQRQVARNVFAIAQAPQLIAFLIAMMGVLGTMLSNVLDRIPEIGALRAIGATTAQVIALVVAESGFLGLSAVIFGVLCSIPQAYMLLHVVSRHENGWPLPYSFPTEAAVRTCLMIVAAAMSAGLLPAQRASAIDVKTALSYE